jgi:hypothetical protein
MGRLLPGTSSFSLVLLSSTVLLTQCPSAAAQSGGATVSPGLFGARNGVAAGSPPLADAKPRSVEPYSATRKVTRVFKLANGTTITQENVTKEARDSSGRTYHENRPEPAFGSNGQGAGFTLFRVYDPVARINMNWSSNTREVTVMHMPEAGQMQLGPVNPPDVTPLGEGTGPVAISSLARAVRPSMPQVEQLGSKTINGLEATGTRTTRVIPAGQIGNDQPITAIHETWMSTDLRIAVLQIDDDPRTGTRTTELTDIERGEPDAALFQAPEGYTVKEHFPNQ